MNKIINEYIKEGNYNNANANYSISGLKTEIAHKILKEDLLSKSPAAEYHKAGDLYLHDLSGGEYSSYCAGHDLQLLLLNGIKNPSGGSSEPAKHLDVAVDHIVNYIYISQNEFEGAQAFSFHPNTSIIIKRNGIIETYALEQLFEIYKHNKINTDNQEIIFPPFMQSYSLDDIRVKNSKLSRMDKKFIFQNDDLEVLNGNTFVKIKAISRHKNIYESDELISLQTESGRVIIVTKSHPIILKNNIIKSAKDIKIDDELISINNNIKLNGNISLDKNFAWLLGMMIAEGSLKGYQVNIAQKNTSEIIKKVKSLGIHFTENFYKYNGKLIPSGIAISSTSLGRLILSFFGLRKYAKNKNLPLIIFNCDYDTIGAIISGYIDGDGDITHYNNKSSLIRINSTAYTLLLQIQSILDIIGITSTLSIRLPNKNNNKCRDSVIIQKNDVYTLRFRIEEKYKNFFKMCNKINNSKFKYKIKETPLKSERIVKINKCLNQSEYVYDISTESKTFTINNILVHNSNFDTYLAPFIKKDNLDYNNVKQSLQRMVFNLSYPLRAAFQTPFSNLSLDLKPPNHIKNEAAVIGGEAQEFTYGKCQKEMDMINLALLDVMIEGDRDGNPHTFPILTYSITEDFDWDSEVSNRIFELTAKFGTPYFSNYLGSGLDPKDSRSMCCRLRLDISEVMEQQKAGGLWNTGISTGSTAVVTINMSRIGYLCTGNEKCYFKRLNNLLEVAKQHLEYKREKINKGFELGLMPFTREYLKDFSSHFSTIGIVGMNESCLNMFGKPIYKCQDFVEKVLKHIKQKTKEFAKETGHLYNLEQTPAESASYSLAKIDKEKYPDIITQGEGSGIFYTNSSHNYVGDELSLGRSLKCQERFNQYYTGGTLFHIWAGESSPSPEGVKDLIRNICLNTSLPYIAFTKAYSICPNCGISGDLSGICPKCNGITNVYDRVTGYYRPVTKFNKGKQAEFIRRKRFNLKDTFKK